MLLSVWENSQKGGSLKIYLRLMLTTVSFTQITLPVIVQKLSPRLRHLFPGNLNRPYSLFESKVNLRKARAPFKRWAPNNNSRIVMGSIQPRSSRALNAFTQPLCLAIIILDGVCAQLTLNNIGGKSQLYRPSSSGMCNPQFLCVDVLVI